MEEDSVLVVLVLLFPQFMEQLALAAAEVAVLKELTKLLD